MVPADRKWYRDWAVAHLLRETFDDLDLGYPPADFDVAAERRRLCGYGPAARSPARAWRSTGGRGPGDRFKMNGR